MTSRTFEDFLTPLTLFHAKVHIFQLSLQCVTKVGTVNDKANWS